MIRAAVLVALLALPAAAQGIPEPGDYRGEPYRAPVPETLKGAQVIDGSQALDLHEAGQAVFVDVFPRTLRPEGLPEGTIWREPPHQTIPGAIWLWNTGYQALSPEEQARLRDGLTAAQGDSDRPLVIFCREECWMSWNAARRAVEWGFSPVYWFPGGTDDWLAEGGASLVTAVP